MEHSSRGLASALLLLLLLCAAPAFAATAPYFTLSTNKTFAPTEKPRLHLYTRNVPELEFRVYHINDEQKFLANLSEMHSFADPAVNKGLAEQIDEPTLLERFHDWKSSRWYSIKSFFRTQLSRPTREAMQEKQSSLAQRSRIVGVAQFAQIPLLNDKQIVARWRQQVPPTFVSDNQILPIEPLGSGMYLVEATDGHLKAYTLLLVSQTALVTRTVAGQMLAYVVDRVSGKPVPNAEVTLALGKSAPTHRTTLEDGVAAFTAPPPAKAKAATVPGSVPATDPGTTPEDDSPADNSSRSKLWVLARSGKDVALVAPWYTSFTQQQMERYASYTYTDRPVYRPGHTVHFKSILRDRVADTLALPKVAQVQVTVTDDQQKVIFDKQLALSNMGSVQGEFELPAAASLGFYNISIGSDAYAYASTSFRVEEYRKPEYQVRVSAAKPRVLQGGTNQVTIDARYFFGEPVANAKVKYRVYHSPHYWWGDPETADENSPGLEASNEGTEGSDNGYIGEQNSEQTGTLNADGKLTATIPTAFIAKDHLDRDYVIEGAVTDDAGREITGRYRFLASYGSYRIHVEPLSYGIQQGQQAALQITAVDYDNNPVQTSVHLHLYQHKSSPRSVTTTENTLADTDVTTGPDGTAIAHVPVNAAGSVNILATSNTPEKRQLQDNAWLWVSGTGQDQDWYGSSSQQARILADKKSYAPGEIAHLTLISPVEGFHALVTATGYSLEFHKTLSTTTRTLTIDLPITQDSQPNLTVDAIFLKDDQLYQATKSIKVPPAEQQLQITVTPAATTFQPGQAALYDVTAHDSKGQPVSAELSFGVVDEAIYALYPDTSGDIVKALYPDRYSYAEVESSLTYYFTGEAGLRSPLIAERHSRYRPQLAQVKPGNDAVQPRVRKAFPDTAYWQPAIHTDGAGRARVSLNFPDSLTTWRATVRAITADSKAGSSVNRVIVRKNIIVRMGQPRFMRKGDTITVPVIVHNYLQQPKEIQLSLEASGVEILSGAPQQITVPSRGESVINYRLRASTIGIAKLTAKALSTQESDALEISLPVKPAGVPQTLAASGLLTGTADHTTSVTFPLGTDPAAHTLQVQVSPSIVGALFSALDYLTAFPYGCTEQTMSSFLPSIIVAQAMQQLNLPSKINLATLNAKIDAGLTRLEDYHHADGGWGWWKEDDSQIFMTAYVVSGLAQAKKAGYSRAESVSNSGVDFLKKQLQQHPRMLPELRAYVVYTLAESGNTDTKQLDTLYSRRNDLSPQSLAYTGLAMLDANDRHAADLAALLERKARLEGDLASWPAARNELLDIDYDGSAETTAFVLKFLALATPQSPLLPKAAQWLVANRSEGYWWSSTQQTAFVIYGLTGYLSVSHELSAENDVEVFVNGNSAAKRHFTKDDAVNGASLSLELDTTRLQPQQNSIRVVTHGNGRAYWSTQGGFFSTAKSSYQQGTLSLNITRDYFVLVPTSKDGRITYNLQPLNGPVSQGDVLAVHLGVSGSPQKYLLIEDPIPSGTEFLKNTDSYEINQRPSTWDWWYTRQEFHDDRAAIFATTFSGRHDSFYLLKVINPGSFDISPARVAPMYQPNVQATTDLLHLEVKEVTK